MAEDTFKEDKTESATAKSRQKHREKGNVVNSSEVDMVSSIFIGLVAIYFLAPWLYRQLIGQMHDRIKEIAYLRVDSSNFVDFIMTNMIVFAKVVAPILFFLMLAAFLSGYIQHGWLWTYSTLAFKWSSVKPKLSAINFFKKDKVVDLGVSLCKLAVVGTIAYKTVADSIEDFVPLVNTSVYNIMVFTSNMMFKVMFKVAVVLIVVAIIDYIYRYFKRENDIKMTKQEVKDERKNSEGDPQIKAAIKRKQMEMAVKRMFAEVPKADVVITNPTHLAIAIKYDSTGMNAPVVLAKGKRLIAERIKEIARANGVPIVENKPLARAMYDAVEIGMQIPIEFYKAVAQILARIYQGRNQQVR